VVATTRKLLSFSRSILSKILDIWILTKRSTGFVIVVKLDVSSLRVSAKRFIHWEGC